MKLSDVKQDKRFIQFIYEFNVTRDYYYCHDLLEELWMKNRTEFGSLKYLLQIAVMQYKKVNNQDKGFQIYITRAFDRFADNEQDLIKIGIDTQHLFRALEDIKISLNLVEFELKLTEENK